eukprot:TRINITY_DN15443_c0_g1_i2.p1 TRINITY_DN15443_c0_g1~~TRINITY_DN15443_c0_g1_i2.p1  ORF type:complete len:491 (+),score=120.25 TRINITY_DN15443_c0_g1_i2:84-1556(+)
MRVTIVAIAVVVLATLCVLGVQAEDPERLKGNYHMGCHTWPVTNQSYGPPNTFPIVDATKSQVFVKSVPNGHLYNVTLQQSGGNTSNWFYVVHVYGKPYDWGYAIGSLAKNETYTFITDMWTYLEGQVDSVLKNVPKWLAEMIANAGLDVALDLTYDATKAYMDPKIFDEMQGLADAAGVDYKKIRRVHMLAGLTQGKCSMLGAWGKATTNGNLIQLRALDWDMQAPVRDYSAITVYHPSDPADGHSFINIGILGFLGSLSGVSSKQLGISEIGVSFPDSTFGSESRFGIPFIFLLREILQYDNSIDDATNRMIAAPRTCDLILGVGDGQQGIMRGYEYSYSTLKVIGPNNLQPVNSTWHKPIEDVVYFGMDWDCPSFNMVLHDAIQKSYGQISPTTGAQHVSATEMSGDNHLAYYDLTAMQIMVSFASPHNVGGPAEAYARQYASFDAKALLAVTPPPATAPGTVPRNHLEFRARKTNRKQTQSKILQK